MATASHIIDIPFQEQERRLLTQLKTMRDQDQLCDMTIRVGTRTFRCHQAVLAASSAHFCSVFIQGALSFPKILDLTFTSADIFSIILDFVYTASLKCPKDILPQVLQAAKVLEIHTLVDHLLLFSAAFEDGNNTCTSNEEMAQSSLTNSAELLAESGRNLPELSAQSTCTNLPVPASQSTCTNLPVPAGQSTCTNLPVPSSGEPTCTISPEHSAQPCTTVPVLTGQPTCTNLPLPVPSGVHTPVSTPDSGVQDHVMVKQEEQEYDQEEVGQWSEDCHQEEESMVRQITELRAEVIYLRQQLRTAIGDPQQLRTAIGDPQQGATAVGDQQQIIRTRHGSGPGKTELLPGTGVYISQSDLHLLTVTAGYSGRQLCHNLFDHFYRNVDLSRYTAFPHRNGTVGKIALDQNVLEAIQGFVLKMTTEEMWNADVTKGQIHRIFGNKCTAALRGTKRRLVMSCS
ncbi:uncharacterized protein LOC144923149 [Branchiostoma floridae x Branchiostoma belcheri]